MKKTSQEWLELLHEIDVRVVIHDPDGWDRKNFTHSWYEEKITAEEFRKRCMFSTMLTPNDSYPIDELVNQYGEIQNVKTNNA